MRFFLHKNKFDLDARPDFNEGLQPETPEDAVLSAYSTLIITVEDKGSKIVQFSQLLGEGVLDLSSLRTSEIENFRHYYVRLDAAHTVLAWAYLAVLLQLNETVDKRRLEMFRLAFYATQHWIEDAMYEEVNNLDCDIYTIHCTILDEANQRVILTMQF
jgi:hypothetical protein